MTRDELQNLLSTGIFPDACRDPELVETHISWVIICDEFVYKIKKPVHYSFLDFSTLEKRKYYCEREVVLNQRLTHNLYRGVVPIVMEKGFFKMDNPNGRPVEYAVGMKRLDCNRQMDLLLRKNQVTIDDIQGLAKHVVNFHKRAAVIAEKDIADTQIKFNDLNNQKDKLKDQVGCWSSVILEQAMQQTTIFFEKSKSLLTQRLREGFFRDVHGDLHARNIFLFDEPVVFDCIEFNDEYRCIDVLNEAAFLCMDLDAFGRSDLSDFFIHTYNYLFPVIRGEAEQKLFIYYKCYRANVRTKVNSLRADGAGNAQRQRAIQEVEKYLKLMKSYTTLLTL